MAEKEDRRVRYTKALLRDALTELMQDSHISEVSVTSLCEAADVHRSTFYAHYTNQYDLLGQIQSEVLDVIRHRIEEQQEGTSFPLTVQKLVAILEYGKKNARLVKVLLSDHSDGAFQKAIMALVHQINYYADLEVDDPMRMYISLFGLHGCISIIQRWLDTGMQEPTEQIAGLIIQLTLHGNCAYLAGDAQ